MASIMALVAGVLAAQGLVQALLYTYPPWISGIARKQYPGQPNVLPDIASLVSMRYKETIDSGVYSSRALQLGFTKQVSEQIFTGARRMLDADSYIRVWRRGKLSDGELTQALTGLQFNEEDQARVKIATEFFPNPQDLIRFAVREVYSAEIRTKFRMDEDITGQFLTEAAKAGVPEDQAGNFWAAHWDLPSVQQVFEMRHREVIDDDERDVALRALDIMPFWRDKLTEIAYRPFTRVDVRRMHGMGKLTDAETKQAYKDIGYDEKKAEKMLAFTQAFNQKETTGISRGSLVNAFKSGLINSAELTTYFQGLGYAEDVTAFYVRQAEFEKVESEVNDKRATLFERYRLGDITKERLREMLGYGGLPASYVDTQMERVESERVKKIKMPSRTDLTDWLKLGIIKEEYYVSEMIAIGYREQDVELYLQEIILEIEEIKPRYLSDRVYQRWLKAEIITEERFREILTIKGVSVEDINNLIMEMQEIE